MARGRLWWPSELSSWVHSADLDLIWHEYEVCCASKVTQLTVFVLTFAAGSGVVVRYLVGLQLSLK